jgi:hypothetical protein
VRVSANRRHLVHDGRPFFYLADTAWKLLTGPTEEEARHYLRVRREQGFTVIMPVLATERTRGEEAERSAFLDDDPDRPDEAFFARVDRLVEYANRLGLWMALLPAWGSYVGGNERDRPVLDPENARRYGAYLGRRYGERDVIWVIGGDRRVGSEREAAVWRALARGVREGDGGEHVMTFHPPGLQGGGHSSRWFHEEEWLDFNLLQTGVRFLEEDLCGHYLADYNRQPPKPFLDGETRYENSHRNFSLPRPMGPKITAYHVRQAAYYAMLCGAAGHTYGCRDVWSFYVPSDAPPTRCVDTDWRQALHLPGARQLRHWRALFEGLPWYRLVPDQPDLAHREGGAPGSRGAGRWAQAFGQQTGSGRLLTHGAWDGTANLSTPAALAEDGSVALVYLPLPMPVWIDLTQIAGDAVEAIWFDPRTGEERYVGRYTERAEPVRFFPPGDESAPDWALVLRTDPLAQA